MKIIVRTQIDVRHSSANADAPSYQQLAPGSVIEVDGKLYDGDIVEGNNKWYKDQANNYYWSGGVEEYNNIEAKLPEDNIIANEQVEKFDFNKILQLKSSMPDGNGNQITISILDTGIYSNPAISERILLQKSKSFIELDNDPVDFHGHGTCVAGIICGDSSQIKGLAIQSKLINYKVINNSCHVDSDAVLSALKHIVENDLNSLDLINMSFSINEKLIPQVQNYIKTIQSKGIIIVVAAGNDNDFNKISLLKDVIKVGTIDSSRFIEIKGYDLTNNYTCLFTNKPILTCTINNKYDYFGATSAYTAVITGTIAKFLSDPKNKNIPKQNRFPEIINFLRNSSFSLKTESKPEILKMYIP